MFMVRELCAALPEEGSARLQDVADMVSEVGHTCQLLLQSHEATTAGLVGGLVGMRRVMAEGSWQGRTLLDCELESSSPSCDHSPNLACWLVPWPSQVAMHDDFEGAPKLRETVWRCLPAMAASIGG